ncbi:hypothetical protein LX16_5349 [Stackebrandtia albiflava]|uniref:ABC-2 family transporter n=1 Tax=Stackebrandtia albiflava TaxID=406432 RepID=A0A562UL93_9ACTN|nr:hypothetical protein [Stackebrandtia albiflava]TWJ06385.1 hypothetical protein LX16_5349 [Stackebrandtia albiflava]
MTWLAFRQQRLSLIVSAMILGPLLVISGLIWLWPATVPEALTETLAVDYAYVSVFMLMLPPLLGTFTGAPLFAREFEQGTFVFGVTQSVSIHRWVWTKVAVAAVPFLALLAVVGVTSAYARDGLPVRGFGFFSTPGFETHGVILGAYGFMAFGLAAALGIVLRNTVAAMALTVLLYVVIALVVGGMRSYDIDTRTVTVPFTEASENPAATAFAHAARSTGGVSFLDEEGREVTGRYYECGTACVMPTEVSISYTSMSSYFALQAQEALVYTAVGGAALAGGVIVLRRRLD